MRLFAQLRGILVFLTVLFVALATGACQTQNAPLPTLISLDGSGGGEGTGDTGTAVVSAATETPEPTAPPNTPTPIPVLGRFATDPERLAHFNFIHAASGTDVVDVYINSETLTYGLAFKLDTGRTPILSGSYTVRVTPRGGSLETDVLVSAEFSIRPGESKFTVLNGTPDALALQILTENNAPLDPGRSRLTFLHTVPRLPDTAPAIDGQTIGDKVAFAQISPALVVREQTSGVVGLQDEFQTFASREMDLRSRGSYTFVLVGDSADLETLSLLSYEVIVPQRVSLRVINVTQNIGAVDVYLDSLLLGGNVDVTRASERVDATTNARLLSVYPAGADRATGEPLLRDLPFVVDSTASTHSLIVMGDANSLRVVAVPEDLSPIRPDYARIVFVNSLASAPAVRVGGLSELIEEIPEIQYGQFSQPVMFGQGSSRFFWREMLGLQEGSIIERVDDFIIEAGRSYIYLLTGRDDGVAIAFSEPVIIDPALELVDLNVTPGAEDVQPKVRFINALDSAATINVVVDNTGTPIPLAYGQGSAIIPLTTQVFAISIQAADTGLPLRTDTVTLQEPGTNTLVIYGDTASLDVRFLVVSDKRQPAVESVAEVRLINLTRDQRLFFGLRLGDATDPTMGSVYGPVETWPTLPIGGNLLTTRVGGNSASPIFFVAGGIFDVQIYDVQREVIGQVIRSFTITTGMDYDVIAFEMLSAPSPEIRAFVVPYPQP